MRPFAIRRARRQDSRAFLSLVDALADFEKLRRPSPAARRRLIRDTFGRRKRIEAFLAFAGPVPVGYAIIFETYSSFLSLPTLYLEDIFVLPEYRSLGIGLALFKTCVRLAHRRHCGRMEWVVLDWNVKAIRFYKRLGAQQLKEWLPFRLAQKDIRRLAKT